MMSKVGLTAPPGPLLYHGNIFRWVSHEHSLRSIKVRQIWGVTTKSEICVVKGTTRMRSENIHAIPSDGTVPCSSRGLLSS